MNCHSKFSRSGSLMPPPQPRQHRAVEGGMTLERTNLSLCGCAGSVCLPPHRVEEKHRHDLCRATARCGVARARGTCSPDGMDAQGGWPGPAALALWSRPASLSAMSAPSQVPVRGRWGAVPRRFHPRDGVPGLTCFGEMARRFRQLIVTPEAVTAAPQETTVQFHLVTEVLAPPPEEACLPPGPRSSPCSTGSFQ